MAAVIAYLDDDSMEQFDAGQPAGQLAKPARREPVSRESLLEGLSRILAHVPEQADMVLPIDGLPAPTGQSAVSEMLDRPPTRKRALSDRWRLAFVVTDRPQMRHHYGYPSSIAPPHACILPALQYIRKGGQLGRLDKYRADVEREGADAASETLLDKVLLDEGEAPLLLHWDFILGSPELPLYLMGPDGRGRYDHPLRPGRISRIRIGARLDTAETGAPSDVRVQPVVSADFEEESGPLEIAWADAWGGKLVALAGQRLGWCQGNGRLLGLVHRLSVYRQPMDRAHLAELKHRIVTANDPLIVMDFPFGAMRVATRRPQPQLVLQPRADGTDARLVFRYPAPAEMPGATSEEWIVLRRDAEFEEGVRATLDKLFTRGYRRVKADYGPWGVTSDWGFRAGMAKFLEAFGADLLSRGIGLSIGDPANRLSHAGAPFHVRVSSGIDWFDLSVSAGEELDLAGVDPDDPLFAHGFVRSGNRVIYIGTAEVEKLRRLIALLDRSQKIPRVSRRDLEGAALLADLVPEAPLELVRAAEISRALAAPAGLAPVEAPGGFQGTLRDYQRVGLGWLSFLAEHELNGCLADDMGLGKTIQTLALLQRLKEKDGSHPPSLVVAPVSTLRNWETEAGRFTPGLRTHVHHGSERPRDVPCFREADIVIVSYATLRNDLELFQQQEWDVLVLDEAQSIKNPGTQSFAAVKTLSSRHRFTLTGTPLENSVIDLWAQFDFLEPGLLGSMQRFRKQFGSRGTGSSESERQRLRRIVRPFILRRTKEVVEKSLPPREEVRLFAEMGAQQKEAYDALKEGYRARIAAALKEKGIAQSGALIFEGLLRLRQAACVPEHAGASLKGTPSAKLDLLEEVLTEIISEGHRILVFSQFVKSLGVIARILDQRRLPYAYLDGSTRNRQQVIDRFQTDPSIPLFLLSLKAGGLGINLTAADYVLIFDPWWNPAVERQAVDRSHRIGQTKPVFVYRLITKETIEERILRLQEQKSALAAELIEENPKSLLALGEEELLGLFR